MPVPEKNCRNITLLYVFKVGCQEDYMWAAGLELRRQTQTNAAHLALCGWKYEKDGERKG